MLPSTRTFVRMVAALSLVAAFALTPSAADAGNFKHRKFHNSGKFQHKHLGHFNHHHGQFHKFHGHHFQKHNIHKPYLFNPYRVNSLSGNVVAVPYGNGIVYVIK